MKLANEVRAAIEAQPGRSVNAISKAMPGSSKSQVYSAVQWLEARGEVKKDGAWPACWYPVAPIEPADATPAARSTNAIDVVHAKELLAEAMAHPSWASTPAEVKRKVEHAWVVLDREGEIPALPELPPGYQIEWSDDGSGAVYCGWQIRIRGEWYDGLPDDEQAPQERDDAVALCWDIWLDVDADDAWRDYVSAHRGEDDDDDDEEELDAT